MWRSADCVVAQRAETTGHVLARQRAEGPDPPLLSDRPCLVDRTRRSQREPSGGSSPLSRALGGRRPCRAVFRSPLRSSRAVPRDGYAPASLDAVCEGAGMTERSLYHFRGKRELCEAVFKEEARHHRARRHRNGHAGRALGGDEAALKRVNKQLVVHRWVEGAGPVNNGPPRPRRSVRAHDAARRQGAVCPRRHRGRPAQP
ncbi:helix-turn-helix transcriptional regulator [Actinomadura montaniterrae]|uniref:Helix-turn-helix transcriptional regulator n=1 Tax=Actinomadura montaniterrae TaxID=1803903 RepID=A0A6L3W1Q4_9ACTN|nr:helix-turn-helix transcriptional regulator [Actinomadura montaniterrae]